MGVSKVSTQIGDVSISLETGRLAKQAAGSVVGTIGETMILVTACDGPPREGIDFFPMSVDYIAKTYAAGKIPGGFFKREGKPSEKEILSARLIDRPLRPLFPEGYKNELQIIGTVISADDINDADVIAITAASCALTISHIPFLEPVAAVRVGRVDGELKIFPTLEETSKGSLDMVVAGSENSIMMVEGGAYEIDEEVLIDAISLAHTEIKKLVGLQKELAAQVAVEKEEFISPESDKEIFNAVSELVKDKIHDVSFLGIKKDRYKKVDELRNQTIEQLAERFPDRESEIASAFHDIEVADMRSTIIEKGERIGGRDCDTIRDISCDLDILPRAHGSALFTRGETQSLAIATLGTKIDEQKIDYIQAEYYKSYMLHYNFPPFSVGEVKRLGSVSRREIGHGHLAERALAPILPNENSFPYTIRLVSEILESNGSSSMASVCGSSLALMAAGVPIKAHCAGVAMGLIKEGDKVAILTDILGTEDHLGDMDFKVTGTRDGVTAIQMDIKIHGITPEIMREALAKARTARFSILDSMESAIKQSREEVSQFAPSIITMSIDKEKIRDIIGPGGKIIRQLQEDTGSNINIEDDGTVQVVGPTLAIAKAGQDAIKNIVFEPEVGEEYDAVVKTIVDFGAFVEFKPGREGLVHISELEHRRVAKVEDVLKLGDKLRVKIIGVDRNGKVKLSRKALIPNE